MIRFYSTFTEIDASNDGEFIEKQQSDHEALFLTKETKGMTTVPIVRKRKENPGKRD
jgi:hypothetical protein